MVIDVVIFIVIVVLTMTVLATIFGGWLIVSLVCGTSRRIGRSSRQRSFPATELHQCAQRGCLMSNPAEARFCRRCGTPLMAARSSSAARRAACW